MDLLDKIVLRIALAFTRLDTENRTVIDLNIVLAVTLVLGFMILGITKLLL